MKNQIVIESDVLDICGRLKEIDQSYYIVFNLSRKKFEVHSSSQNGGTFAFCIPFDCLDDRTIDLARKTSIYRKDEIIKEIDNENQKLQKRMFNDAVDHLKEVFI